MARTGLCSGAACVSKGWLHPALQYCRGSSLPEQQVAVGRMSSKHMWLLLADLKAPDMGPSQAASSRGSCVGLVETLQVLVCVRNTYL